MMHTAKKSLALLILACSAHADTGPPEVTAANLQAFVDNYWTENATRQQVPGMTFAWVENGKTLLTLGYGHARVTETGTVDPDRDVFRVGSVSKIFVGLAAAKLIARGDVDPHADINDYLDFAVPALHGVPITLHDLLTHQAGLDDLYFGDTSRTAEGQEALGEHLARRLPPQIHPAGTTMSYSNYGYALGAYVLERASGVDFATLVQGEILAPLGMDSSGFRQDDEWSHRLARGYDLDGGQHIEMPYTFTHRYPSTTFMTTAEDMARLIEGLYSPPCDDSGDCVFPQGARDLIFQVQARMNPELPGRSYAFSEWLRHGERGLWHDGGTAGFAAQFFLVPESKSGFFIAENLQSSGFTQQLKSALLDHFFPRGDTAAAEPEIAAVSVDDYAGSYGRLRRNHGTIEKMQLLRDGAVNFEASAEGALTVFGSWRLVPVGEGLFRRAGGDGRLIVFRSAAEGQPTLAYLDWGGMAETLERLPFWDVPRNFYGAVGAALILLLLASIRWRNARLSRLGAVPRRALLALTPLCWLFVIGLAAYLFTVDPLKFRFGEAGVLYVLLTLPLLALPLAALVVFDCGRVLLAGDVRAVDRVMAVLLPASLAGFFLVLWQWNLLGYHF